MDDEFAKGVGEGYDGLEALREEVVSNLTQEAESKASQEHRDQIIEALLEGAAIELPPLMLEHEIDHMESERSNMLAQVNIRLDDYLQSIGKTRDDMRNEIKEEAVQRLERTFALTHVAELEGLEVSDEDVDDRIKTIIEESSQEQPEQEITEQTKSSVRQMILAERTLERLEAIAKGEAPELEVVVDEEPEVAVDETSDEEESADGQEQSESEEEKDTIEGELDDTKA